MGKLVNNHISAVSPKANTTEETI